MIEIPRAALTADEIAKEADFFCFGTNDLTQMTFGFSRDDAGKFLNAYYESKIFENDPFAKLDQNGVGKLMEMTIKLGRPVNPDLHIGICGEHGGDPSSVAFCHKIGLDYVSCSPFRVPIARLAAKTGRYCRREIIQFLTITRVSGAWKAKAFHALEMFKMEYFFHCPKSYYVL